jgi:hypothetical protein
MNDKNTKIDWNYPSPRTGFAGFIDRLVGPGATRAELWIQFGFAVLAGLFIIVYSVVGDLGWSVWQTIVAGYLAFDICGGIATNATSSAKRWWHREERRTLRADMRFIIPHIYMPLLIMLAFMPGRWDFVFIVYGYLIVGALIISRTQLYLRRPVSVIMYSIAIFGSMVLFSSSVRGVEWFIPLLFLKLFVSHLNFEEPYRP